MPNKIKYNSGIDTNALNIGNWSVGASNGMGPSVSTGFKNGLHIPANGYAIYANNIDGRIAANDAELVSILNKMGASVADDDVSGALIWAKNQNILVLNSNFDNIATSGIVFNVDAKHVSSFVANERTENLVTDSPSQGGWAGDYQVVDSSTKTFLLRTQQNDVSVNSAWRTWYWNVSSYIGSDVTISADVEFIVENNCTFSSLVIGQGNTGQYPIHITGSDAADKTFIDKPITKTHASWTGIINATGIVGFTFWINNVVASGANAIVKVSNVQIEARNYETPFVNGIRQKNTTWWDLSGYQNNTNVSKGAFNENHFISVGDNPSQLIMWTPNSTTLNNTFSKTTGGWHIEELIKVDDWTYPEAPAGTVVSGSAYGAGRAGFDWNHGNGMGLGAIRMGASNNIGEPTGYDVSNNVSIPSYLQTPGKWLLRSLFWDRTNNTAGAYINGVYCGSISIAAVAGKVIYDGGGINWGTLYGWHHDGGRASMRIYDRVLSANEVSQNYYGGPIVTDGLFAHFDASNMICYNPGEFTWYNMASRQIETIYAETEYTSNKGGALVVNGSGQRGIKVDGFADKNEYTISIWFKRLDGPVQAIGRIAGSGGGTGGIDTGDIALPQSGSLNFNGPRGTWTGVNASVAVEETVNITMYFNETTGNVKAYKNGELVADITQSDAIEGNFTHYVIGNRSDFNGEYFPAEYYAFSVYNKELTQEEVLQNYNALAARFS